MCGRKEGRHVWWEATEVRCVRGGRGGRWIHNTENSNGTGNLRNAVKKQTFPSGINVIRLATHLHTRVAAGNTNDSFPRAHGGQERMWGWEELRVRAFGEHEWVCVVMPSLPPSLPSHCRHAIAGRCDSLRGDLHYDSTLTVIYHQLYTVSHVQEG